MLSRTRRSSVDSCHRARRSTLCPLHIRLSQACKLGMCNHLNHTQTSVEHTQGQSRRPLQAYMLYTCPCRLSSHR